MDSVGDPKSRNDGMAERKKTTPNSKALRHATTEQWNGGRAESHSKSQIRTAERLKITRTPIRWNDGKSRPQSNRQSKPSCRAETTR